MRRRRDVMQTPLLEAIREGRVVLGMSVSEALLFVFMAGMLVALLITALLIVGSQ